MVHKNSVIALSCLTALCGVALGVIVGHFTTKSSNNNNDEFTRYRKLTTDAYTEKPDITEELIKHVQSDRLRETLR